MKKHDVTLNIFPSIAYPLLKIALYIISPIRAQQYFVVVYILSITIRSQVDVLTSLSYTNALRCC